MNKKEVIEILHKEVGIVYEFHDEDEKGELYITKRQFMEAEQVIKGLERKRKDVALKEKQLIRMIKKNKGNYVDVSDNFLKDKTLKIKGDLAFLQPNNLLLTHCNFLTKKDIRF